MRARRWRAIDGQAPPAVQRGHRPFRLGGSEAASLIDSLERLRADAVAIARAAVDALDPVPLTTHALQQHSDLLGRFSQIAIVAAGKAAWPMASAASSVLDFRLTGGVVTGVAGDWPALAVIEAIPGSHPLADVNSLRAAERSLEIAAMIHDRGGLLLALLSGGGSAMLAKPTRGITLEDKQSAIDILSRSGVPIAGINCVRRHLSAIKGGRLAAAAGHCLTLAISDVHVPPDDPSTIASGPTVGDPSTFHEALQVIDAAAGRVPVAVRDLLERGAAGRIDETPKPGDASLRGAAFKVIANRQSAMAGAMRLAEQRRYDVHVIDAAVTGEAAVAGMAFVRAALGMFAAEAPACAIASGETTVKVRGAGRGGRNQEFVIGAAMELTECGSPPSSAAPGPTVSTVRRMPQAVS